MATGRTFALAAWENADRLIGLCEVENHPKRGPPPIDPPDIIIIVTGGKANMSRPLAIANELCIRAFVVIDADAGNTNVEQQKRGNTRISRLRGIKEFDPTPKENL